MNNRYQILIHTEEAGDEVLFSTDDYLLACKTLAQMRAHSTSIVPLLIDQEDIVEKIY